MTIDFDTVQKLTNIVTSAGNDALRSFVANHEKELLLQVQEKNLKILFAEAQKHKVRYIYVGRGEIAGCENKQDSKSTYSSPAMWAIAKSLGFPASCGNGDQYQCHGSEKVFPPESYGGWDLQEMRQLTNEESDQLKFFRVVTRPY